MKKFLLSLIALLGVVSANAQTTADVSSYTDDVAYVEGASYYYGVDQIDLTILFKQVNDMSSCAFILTLPEGLSFIEDESAESAGTPTGVAYDNHDFMGDIKSATEAKIVLVSMKQTPIAELAAKVRVAVDKTKIVAGTEYNVVISEQNLANGSGKEVFQNDPITSTIVFEDVLTFNETDETLAKFIDGQTANVVVNRTIKAGQWSTVVLPFALNRSNATTVFGADASYAKLSKVVTTYEDEDDIPESIEIQFESYTVPRAGIAAGELFLVKTTKDIESIPLDGVVLNSAITDVTGKDSEGSNYKFTGSYVKTIVPENGLFISSNKFYYSKGTTNIKGFRAWFELDAVLGQETPFVKMNIIVDGEETAIDDIRVVDTKGAVYTIDGKFIGRDVDLKKLQKGIYVVDGKKVAVK